MARVKKVRPSVASLEPFRGGTDGTLIHPFSSERSRSAGGVLLAPVRSKKSEIIGRVANGAKVVHGDGMVEQFAPARVRMTVTSQNKLPALRMEKVGRAKLF